ncbi:unnamed protein product [Somion occarium]
MMFYKEGYGGWPALGWQKITHVCRWWRGVALQTASLWSHINISNVERTRAHLSRSRGAPLDIYVSSPCIPCPAEAVVDLLIPHSRRIANFDVSVAASSAHAFARLLLHPLPMLHRFRFTNGLAPSPIPLRLTLNIGEGQSQFQDLELCMAYIPWESPAFQGLRTLKLLAQIGDDATPSMNRFLDILECSPQLEVLSLVYAGPVMPIAGYPEPMRKIRLASLRDLNLTIHALDAADLLTHLQIPKTTKIEISCHLEELNQDFSTLFPPDLNGLELLASVHEIAIECSKDCSKFGLRALRFQDGRAEQNLHVKYKAKEDSGPQWGLTAPDFLRTAAFIFARSPVTRLNAILYSETISMDDWQYLFAQLPGLTHTGLGIGLGEDGTFIDYGLLTVLGGDPGTESVPCPKLTCLEIYHTCFDNAYNDELEQCLRSRAEKGAARLSKLKLSMMRWTGDGEVQWPDVQELVDVFEHNMEGEDEGDWTFTNVQ